MNRRLVNSLLVASASSYAAALLCFAFFWLRNGYWPNLGAAVLFFACGCLCEAALEIYQRPK